MADLHNCPLNPFVRAQLKNPMNLARVLAIEKHLESSSCFHPPLKDICFHGSLDGSSPLLLSCEEGHLDSVKRIVEHWKTDVNAAGSYYYHHGLKILRATPLIIASLKGHSDIVDFLITKGADVSATASTEGCYQLDFLYDGLNPLHAALIDDRSGQSFSEKCAESSKIVRCLLAAGANPNTLEEHGNPMWTERFCGVDATIALVEHGLNLNQSTSKGQTILHHWIEFDDYNTDYTEQERSVIIQLLVDRGADLKAQDANGFTPTLLAAESTRLGILDELLKRDELDRSEKILAMELAGSHLFCFMPVKLDIDKAFGYWCRALELKEGTDPVNKIPLLMSRWRDIEWVSLEDLKQQPWKGWIQGLLTRLKIYAEKSLKAVNNCLESDYFFIKIDLDKYSSYYEYCLEEYGGTNFDVVTVMLAVLEMILRFHLESEELQCFRTKSHVLEELFSSLERDDPFFNEENFTSSMQLISAVDPDCSLTTPPYEFFVILADLPTAMLHGDVRKYLSYAARRDGTLLSDAYYLKDWKTLRLLLHLGADPNVTDHHITQPLLHTATVREEDPRVLEGTHEREQISNEIEYTPAHLLYDYGANPYRINHEGKTAVDIWIEKNCDGKGMQSEAWNHRPHWCRDTVPKLTCLAAKTMHTHAIPYSHPDDLPENHPHLISKKLYEFLENH